MNTLALGITLALITNGSLAGSLVADGGFDHPKVPLSTSCGATDCAGFTVGQNIGPWKVVGPGQQAGAFAILSIDGNYAEGSLVFEPAQGHQALDLTGTYNQGLNGVQTTLKTTAGASYQISFAIGHADRNAYLPPSLVQLTIDGTSAGTFTNSNVTANQINWQTFTYNFTATTKRTTIALYNATTNSNYVGLDAVSVVPLL